MFLVVFTPHQEMQVVSGLHIASVIADFIFEPYLFLPLLFLIFLYAISYFSYHISTGRMGYFSVVVYVFVASLVLFLVQNRGTVEVNNMLLITRESGKYATKVKEEDSEVVSFEGDLPPVKVITGKVHNVPYIVDLFSFLDPVITGIYVASFGVDEWNFRTVDRVICTNPEHIFRYAISYPFARVFNELKERGELNACYTAYLSSFTDQLRKVREEAEKSGKSVGEVVWEKINSFKFWNSYLPLCPTTVLFVGSTFWRLVEFGLEERLSQCAKEFAYDKDKMRGLVEEYAVRNGGEVVENFLTVVAPKLDDLTRPVKQAGMSGLPHLGPVIQKAVKSIAHILNKHFNYSFDLKITLLSVMQGVVQGLLIAFFPIVAVLSLIPTGGSVINYKLLVFYFVAYFLVSLWIPFLWLVYVMVWGRGFVAALQNVF